MSAGTENPQDMTAPWLGRVQTLGLLVGAVGLVVCLVVGLIPDAREGMVRAYLAGYIFWFGLSLGGVALTMLHHLTGGSWGLVIRRPLEAAAMTLLPMAVLFLPIAVGISLIYPWMNEDFVHSHEAVEHKIAWLNPTWFYIRSAGYFAFWIFAALLLNVWSRQQDGRADYIPSRRLQRVSGPGLALVFLTATLASVDWLMSLEPDWYSTIYGPMLICGWGLSTFSAMTIVSALLARTEPMVRFARPVQFNDLGNLMLAFTMLWAYTSFMQYLIIWSGNLAEEIPWYLRRSQGGWGFFAVILILFHFFGPFFFLLMKDLKRRPERLMYVAFLILFMHLIDSIWLVLPSQFLDPLNTSEARAIYIPWGQVLLSLASAVGIGGLWLWFFAGRLKSAPVVPFNDPAAEHIAFEHAQESQGHGA